MTDKAGQLNIPRELEWRYSDFQLIENGAVGMIVSAMDTLLDQRIAIKLLPSGAEIQFDHSRFEQEAKAISRLNHRNVVRLLDFGISENRPYLVMEYVAGLDLARLLASKGVLPPNQVLDIVIQVSHALEHAHKNKVIHGDLKPSHIMIDEKNSVKVLDFGLARILNSSKTDWRLTTSGRALESLLYMSPEKIRGETVDERSDIWGLGLLIAKLTSGETPFSGENVQELLRRRMEESPPALPPMSAGQGLARTLDRIARKALEAEPANRFGDMNEISVRLEDMCSRSDSQSRSVNELKFSQRSDIDKRKVRTEPRMKGVIGSGFPLVILATLGVMAFGVSRFVLSDGLNLESEKRVSKTKRVKPSDVPDGFQVELQNNQQVFKANEDVEDQDLKRLNGTGITYLSFQGNKLITDRGMMEITNLPLEGLVLKEARVGDGGIDKINSFANLRWLDLQGTNITKEGLLQLKPSNKLNSLELRYLKVDDRCLEYIVKSFPNLLHLGLSDTKVTASGLSMLRSLKHLRSVYVGALNLTDDDIDEIVALNVDTIDLSSNPLTDRGIAKLKKARSLRWVGLESCQKLSPHAIKDLKGAFRNIEVRQTLPTDT